MIPIVPIEDNDDTANPNAREPIEPFCLSCKHLMTKHDKVKGCRQEGWVHRCKCKQFVFDDGLFDKQVKEDLKDWEEDYEEVSSEEKQVMEFMKPLVEKHLREYESDAISKSKITSGDTHD